MRFWVNDKGNQGIDLCDVVAYYPADTEDAARTGIGVMVILTTHHLLAVARQDAESFLAAILAFANALNAEEDSHV